MWVCLLILCAHKWVSVAFFWEIHLVKCGPRPLQPGGRGGPDLSNRSHEVSYSIRLVKRASALTHVFPLQVLVLFCSLCSCPGCVCPYCQSCWLPYNTEECERRSEPILHTRTVPPTHTLCIPVHLTLSLSHTFLPFFTRSLSHCLCPPALSLLSSSSMLSALLAVLLTDSSWMSWLGERRDPECVGWPLDSLCMGRAHTTSHTPSTHTQEGFQVPQRAIPSYSFV